MWSWVVLVIVVGVVLVAVADVSDENALGKSLRPGSLVVLVGERTERKKNTQRQTKKKTHTHTHRRKRGAAKRKEAKKNGGVTKTE